MAQGVDHAADSARQFGLKPQQNGESDANFRERIAGELRGMGEYVYAHEAQANAYFDESPDVQDGLMGVMALAEKGWQRKDPRDQVGDEIAAGAIIRKGKKPEMSMAEMMIAIMMSER